MVSRVPTLLPNVTILIRIVEGNKLKCLCGQPLGTSLKGEYKTTCRSCKAQVIFTTTQ